MTDDPTRLPAGMCCRVCALFARCEALFGCNPASQECDFHPVRFSVSPARFLQECTNSDKLRAALEQVKTERDLLLKTRDLMEAEINRLNGVIVDLNDEHGTETAELGSMYLKTDREYQKIIDKLRAELKQARSEHDMLRTTVGKHNQEKDAYNAEFEQLRAEYNSEVETATALGIYLDHARADNEELIMNWDRAIGILRDWPMNHPLRDQAMREYGIWIEYVENHPNGTTAKEVKEMKS